MHRTLMRCIIILLIFFSYTNSSNASEKIVLQLAWKHQFQFAGYYTALHKGYYQEVDLNVTIVEGGEGKFSREEVLSGRAEYGIAGAELLLHRAEGDPFVVLAPIFQHSPSILLIRKDSQINNLQGLIGKRVMLLPGKKDADILAAFLNEGISMESVQRLDQSYNLNDLIERRTDAVSAYITNEPWYLLKEGIESQSISPQTYGVDFYSDCLFTTSSEIQNYPDRVKKFINASLRGWNYALSHSEETIDLILSNYNVKKKRQHLRYEADSIKKIIMPEFVQIGHMNPGRWHHIANTYIKLGLIEPGFSMDGFLYTPHPKTDYKFLIWVVGVALAIILFVSSGAFFLLFFNKKLSVEINRRKKAEVSHRDHIHFLESLNHINQSIQQAGDSEKVIQDILSTTLSIFKCDRAWLLYPCDPDAHSFRVPFEATRPEYPSANELDLSIPITIPLKSDMEDALGSEGPLAFGEGNEKPLSVTPPGDHSVQSQMFMRIQPKEGKTWMFGIHQCSGKRGWSEKEKKIFNEIGRRITDGLNSMLYQQALTETKNLLNAVFDQSPIPMAVADLDTVLKVVNPVCRVNLGIEDLDIVGEPLVGMELPWETYTEDGKLLKAEELPLARAIKGYTK